MTHPDHEQFDGFDELLELLRELYLRPSRRAPKPHTPPIVACVQGVQDSGTSLLGSVAGRLNSPTRRRHVPHALLSAGEAAKGADDDVVAIGNILAQAADQLAREPGGYRFPRFALVRWLLDQQFDPSASTVERIAELRDRLRRRAIGRKVVPAELSTATVPSWVPIDATIPSWVRGLGVLLTPLYFRARQSGRVPGFGRRYRWFLRQPNLAPGLYGSFFGLAERLTAGQWRTEEPEQVRRLLVNAFLEDLRESFRGVGWTLRYRTTVPIVLLDGVSAENGGFALLRTVAAVRNETGRYDPLLLVTTSRQMPPLARPESRPAGAPHRATTGGVLERWRARLPQERRKREVVAWLIVGKLTGASVHDDGPAFRRPSRFPLRTRRAAIGLATTVLLAISITYGVQGHEHSWRTCGDGFTWLGIEPAASDVEREGESCIGVTDGSNAHVLPSGRFFDQVRTTILRQNQEALDLHGVQGRRPLVTLVFLGSLTAPPGAREDALTAEREQLAGAAVLQRVQLDKSPQDFEPLVRVLIANAGVGMEHGPQIAEQLGRMVAAGHHRIVATIGLSESRAETVETLHALARVGLPTVSATLSADELVERSPLFFQIAPQNRRQAQVAAAYAEHLLSTDARPTGRPLARTARIYFSDDRGDIYSNNLAARLEERFAERNFAVETVAFTPGGGMRGTAEADRWVADAGIAGREACDFDGVVLFAARGLPDFGTFAAAAAERCRDRPPFILGGDDVTRYAADRVSRADLTPAVPFQYLSFATSPQLGGHLPEAAHAFFALLDQVFPRPGETSEPGETPPGRSLDGHAALSYDAAHAAVIAVRQLHRAGVPITGQTLWPALMSISNAADPPSEYAGATGTIDFGGRIGNRVPIDKPITVVTFDGEGVSAADNIVCADDRDPPWCPHDREPGPRAERG